MNLESASFYIFKRDKKQFLPIAQEGLDHIFAGDEEYLEKPIGTDEPLPMALKISKEILTHDEVINRAGNAGERIAAQMKSIGAFISVPIFVDRRLTAILNVGRKISGDMFNDMDYDLFYELAKTGEAHLSHAMFLENSIFFSGNVAHDLRSPFKYGIMNEYLEDIAAGFDDQNAVPQAKEALGKLENRLNMVHKMADIMVDVHENVNRFILGKFKPEVIDYEAMAKDMIDSFRKKMINGITLELNIKSKKPLIYAEVLDAQRILSELLTNAFKYTEKGGITVDIYEETPGDITTCVADTGCGIAPAKLDYIYEPFTRVKNDDGKGGIGIGLASIRQLLDANGGRIWVKSIEGQGTQFYFNLPAASENGGAL